MKYGAEFTLKPLPCLDHEHHEHHEQLSLSFAPRVETTSAPRQARQTSDGADWVINKSALMDLRANRAGMELASFFPIGAVDKGAVLANQVPNQVDHPRHPAPPPPPHHRSITYGLRDDESSHPKSCRESCKGLVGSLQGELRAARAAPSGVFRLHFPPSGHLTSTFPPYSYKTEQPRCMLCSV